MTLCEHLNLSNNLVIINDEQSKFLIDDYKQRHEQVDSSLSKVISLDKSMRPHSSTIDEHLQYFPLIISSNDRRLSSRSLSYQTSVLTSRHSHMHDLTRFSFYDNVPSTLNYLSEPLVTQDRSPTLTSSTDRRDSGLESSSIDRHLDSFAVSSTNHRHRSLSSSSSDSHATNTLSTSSRLPSSRKKRVKWHSFTKTHRPSLNSSKYHLGQMSVGQLVALRRAASIRIQELFNTTRIFDSNQDPSRFTHTNRSNSSRQCLLTTALSVVPKLIIRRHQQRKVHIQMNNM
jgi:hypothetical protein